MYYQSTITTPRNTTEANAQETELVIAKGIITRVMVGFPPGPSGLCHVQIRDKGWQIAPWKINEDFAWDNFVFQMDMRYPMVAEPYTLQVLTWNLDDTFEHVVLIGIEMIEGSGVEDRLLAQYPLAEGA